MTGPFHQVHARFFDLIGADQACAGVSTLDQQKNFGVISVNGFRNAGRKSTNNLSPGKVVRLCSLNTFWQEFHILRRL
jgi:hypothetical protein